ncbi:hypothetical protein EV363DRAFT_776574 [Boletus edulis]|nr:hypothetical protein EV363DRAFT_776574 [Boletus edulis]
MQHVGDSRGRNRSKSRIKRLGRARSVSQITWVVEYEALSERALQDCSYRASNRFTMKRGFLPLISGAYMMACNAAPVTKTVTCDDSHYASSNKVAMMNEHDQPTPRVMKIMVFSPRPPPSLLFWPSLLDLEYNGDLMCIALASRGRVDVDSLPGSKLCRRMGAGVMMTSQVWMGEVKYLEQVALGLISVRMGKRGLALPRG